MSTFAEVEAWLKRNLKIEDHGDHLLQVTLELDRGRTQALFFQKRTSPDGQEWAVMESPIAALKDVKLPKLLEQVQLLPCGGLGVINGFVSLRHGVLLTDVDTSEIVQPMKFLIAAADDLEERFSGGDKF